MQVRLKGSLASHRQFVTEELPALVYQTNWDSKVGGKLIRQTLHLDRLSNWKVSQNSPERFEASVFLGRASNRLSLGLRRIGIRAVEQGEETLIELFETKNDTMIVICTLVGFLFCFIPGVFILIGNLLHTSWHRNIIRKVGEKIMERYPSAELSNY